MKANLKIEATVRITQFPGMTKGADDYLMISFDRGDKTVSFEVACADGFMPVLSRGDHLEDVWLGGEDADEFLMQAFENLMQD